MLRLMLRSKIHRATVTGADLDYEGSLLLDQNLIDAAGIMPYQQISVSNVQNGERFETYVISAPQGSGTVCLNGPAARKAMVGDQIIIFCYEHYSEKELANYKPSIVKVDEKNRAASNET